MCVCVCACVHVCAGTSVSLHVVSQHLQVTGVVSLSRNSPPPSCASQQRSRLAPQRGNRNQHDPCKVAQNVSPKQRRQVASGLAQTRCTRRKTNGLPEFELDRASLSLHTHLTQDSATHTFYPALYPRPIDALYPRPIDIASRSSLQASCVSCPGAAATTGGPGAVEQSQCGE